MAAGAWSSTRHTTRRRTRPFEIQAAIDPSPSVRRAGPHWNRSRSIVTLCDVREGHGLPHWDFAPRTYTRALLATFQQCGRHLRYTAVQFWSNLVFLCRLAEAKLWTGGVDAKIMQAADAKQAEMQRGRSEAFYDGSGHHVSGYSSPTKPAANSRSGLRKLRFDGWRASSVEVGPKRSALGRL